MIVTISHEKYYEIHTQLTDPVLGSELGLFRNHLGCDVQLSKLRNSQVALVDLIFDNEEDAMWFKLKWL